MPSNRLPIPGYGVQTATAALARNAYGAGNRKRMKSLINMFLPIEIALMILSGAALSFSAPILVGLFTKSREVITLGSPVLRMVLNEILRKKTASPTKAKRSSGRSSFAPWAKG